MIRFNFLKGPSGCLVENDGPWTGMAQGDQGEDDCIRLGERHGALDQDRGCGAGEQ